MAQIKLEMSSGRMGSSVSARATSMTPSRVETQSPVASSHCWFSPRAMSHVMMVDVAASACSLVTSTVLGSQSRVVKLLRLLARLSPLSRTFVRTSSMARIVMRHSLSRSSAAPPPCPPSPI
jgi:hypothetical protein